jgi:hypothetical protein
MVEVVLSLLLSKFRFVPSDKEIVWEIGGIAAPTEKGRPHDATLPLKVLSL